MSNAISRLNAALSGRYTIERQLGEGGMATVYLARDLKLGGWKDHNTILECHQQPDPDTLRVALENRGRLRSVRAS